MEAFNVQNIIQGDGINISLTGMAIVFSGLIIITVFIQLLPVMLELVSKRELKKVALPKAALKPATGARATAVVENQADEDMDIASVIGLVLHLEQERHFQSDNRYITMNRDGSQQSMWGKKGKMRSTPRRTNYAKV
ncbi:MAG: OadG family protein [SAR324 cluster bacterium]|nr:OadG family protein [SAR324 cluster bacterium]